MDIFEQAKAIVDGEDRSDWEQFPVPELTNAEQERDAYKFSFHPPALTRQEESDLYMCSRCACLCLKLRTDYKGNRFWCLHCGPQNSARRLDR